VIISVKSHEIPGGIRPRFAAVAQLVERVLGKDEVMGPNPISSSVVSVADETMLRMCKQLLVASAETIQIK
jgi:hypothetical protein